MNLWKHLSVSIPVLKVWRVWSNRSKELTTKDIREKISRRKEILTNRGGGGVEEKKHSEK